VSREAQIVLPLEGVEPGDYVVRAVVREGEETIAELVREVRILPGTAPAPTLEHLSTPITPADVLGGAIARRYVSELVDGARGSPVHEAAERAARGAWTVVEPALGAEPSDGNRTWFALRGLARYAGGRFDLAAADLRVAAGEPPSALPSFLLGWVHAAAGEQREAINAWRAAAFADPTLVPAHLAIADAYVRAAEPALAIQALKTGLRALPGSPELRERLAALEKP
jgi:tetratricopeptide (TPR) repeat protein